MSTGKTMLYQASTCIPTYSGVWCVNVRLDHDVTKGQHVLVQAVLVNENVCKACMMRTLSDVKP